MHFIQSDIFLHERRLINLAELVSHNTKTFHRPSNETNETDSLHHSNSDECVHHGDSFASNDSNARFAS